MTLSPQRKRPAIVRAADAIETVWAAHFWLFAALFTLLFLGVSIVKDLRIKMWYDELDTIHMARQAGPEEIVKATLQGCDAAPPLYAIVVHEILPVVRNESLAVRLPSTLGYCGMFLLLLAFCRRRMPALYAWIAALSACQACEMYATEGRGYGLILCAAAGALLCWQYATEGKSRAVFLPLLALCLALMTALHYYALFFFVPLLLAEWVRYRRSGKFDFPLFLAMVVPVALMLALHYPFIEATKQFQAHYHARAAWSRILPWYNHFVFWELLPLPLLALALFRPISGAWSTESRSLTRPEWISLGAFACLPLCVVALSIYTTHAFVDRYVLWVMPAIAIFVSALLSKAARGAALVGVTSLVMVLALITLREANTFRTRLSLSADTEVLRRELISLPAGSDTLVIADPHVFMELSYYGAPQLRERIVFPVSRDLYLRYFGTDSDPLLMTALSRCTGLHIMPYETLLQAHRHFVLAALSSVTPKDYLPGQLIAAGYHVAPIGASTPPALYDVTAP